MLGLFKDKAGGKQFVEFVDLRAKLYSYTMLEGSEDKKYREVTKIVTKGVFNSVTTESVCLAGRNNIDK